MNNKISITELYEAVISTIDPADIDHHCGDLYLRVTPKSQELIEKYEYKNKVSTFVDNIDHVLWYEIPFAYMGKDWRCK